MDNTTTLRATLTTDEQSNWLKAYWGCCNREGDIKVAKTVITMQYVRRGGAGEVTDTEARVEICLGMSILFKAMEIPSFSPDTLSEEACELMNDELDV